MAELKSHGTTICPASGRIPWVNLQVSGERNEFLLKRGAAGGFVSAFGKFVFFRLLDARCTGLFDSSKLD